MRKIVQAAMRSKRSTILLSTLLATLVFAGCGDGAPDEASEASADLPAASVPDSEYAVEIHTAAFDTWLGIARRLGENQTVRSDEYERLFSLPAYRMTYGDHGGSDLNPIILRNVMEHAFAQDGTGPRRPPKKKLFLANFDYLGDRFEAAASLADTLAARGTVVKALERAYPFVPEFRRPEVLHVHFTASSPQMTWFAPNSLTMDVGLALAAGDQLEDMIAATIVRSLAPPAAPLPHEAEDGGEALRSTFRKLHHEGVVNFIERYPTLRLDPEHETYRNNNLHRPRAIRLAVGMLERAGVMMETLLDPDTDALASSGASIDDLFRLGRQYEPTGYAMSSLINDRLGAERYAAAAAAGPSAWLTAYQEAALAGGASGELSDMPPFDEVVLERLLALMKR